MIVFFPFDVTPTDFRLQKRSLPYFFFFFTFVPLYHFGRWEDLDAFKIFTGFHQLIIMCLGAASAWGSRSFLDLRVNGSDYQLGKTVVSSFPQGYLALSGVMCRKQAVLLASSKQTGVTAKHPTMYSSVSTTKNYPAPNVHDETL